MLKGCSGRRASLKGRAEGCSVRVDLELARHCCVAKKKSVSKIKCFQQKNYGQTSYTNRILKL